MMHQLAGKRILVVEDDRVIAEDLAHQMASEGAKIIGPVATVNGALNAIASTAPEGATLNIQLRDELVFPVADVLGVLNIPFVFLTGYSLSDVPARYATVSHLRKPAMPHAVCRALESILATRGESHDSAASAEHRALATSATTWAAPDQEFYAGNAAWCVRAAERVRDPVERAALLTIADRYLDLVDSVRRRFDRATAHRREQEGEKQKDS
jgi:ActR/RegA family two-component response regulator